MKAVQVIAPGQAEFVDVPVPELRPEHALVRPLYLSLCGSDVHMLHSSPLRYYPFPPGTTGHEMVGVVAAVDSRHSALQPGDVTLTLAPEHEAMTEYFLAPVENVLPLPPGRPVEQLLQAQQLGTVIYACRQLPNLIGKDVAVVGQGSAGLWFNTMLKRLGARRIIALDLQSHRLAVSRRYGATHTIHNIDVDPVAALQALNEGALADVVIEAAGEIDSINLAVSLAREHGFMLQFGVPRAEIVPMTYQSMFFKCLTVKGIVHASRDPGHRSTRQALQWIADGEVDAATFITHRFPFADVMDAYELQRTSDEGAIKIVVEMPGAGE